MFNEKQLGIAINAESIQNENTSKSFFDDNQDILEKGSVRCTITEDDDREVPTTTITREYSSFDSTLNYREEITVASSIFKERKKMIIENQDIALRMKFLKDRIQYNSKLEKYEICKEMKKELDGLEDLLKNK